MSNNKIIFSGPTGAGKSTAIATISDIEPFTTEETATDETRERKEMTTVALDYGALKLDDGERIHLYGTPGQKRFDFMWEILAEGAIGLILMVDNMRPKPLEDLQSYLKYFDEFIKQNAVAIGVTRMDLKRQPEIGDYYRVLKEYGLSQVPVFEADAREHDDVVLLVQALLYSLDPGVAS